jgi:hypothetical protein
MSLEHFVSQLKAVDGIYQMFDRAFVVYEIESVAPVSRRLRAIEIEEFGTVRAVNVNRGVPHSEGFIDVAYPETALQRGVDSVLRCLLLPQKGAQLAASVIIIGVEFLRAEIQKGTSGLKPTEVKPGLNTVAKVERAVSHAVHTTGYRVNGAAPKTRTRHRLFSVSAMMS